MPSYVMHSTVYCDVLSGTAGVRAVAQPPSLPTIVAHEVSEAVPEESLQSRPYSVVAQTVAELKQPDNSPSVSMWPYLLASAQTQRLNEISVYAEKGLTPEATRYLYMNDVALEIWQTMHRDVQVLTRLHRPPRGAVLSFGMPFSE